MKKIFFLFFCLSLGSLTAFSTNDPIGKDKKFSISGKVKGWGDAPAKLFFIYYNGDNRVVDSLKLVDNKFKYEGKISCPVVCKISSNLSQNMAEIFVAPEEEISIKGNAKELLDVRVKGGKYTELMDEYLSNRELQRNNSFAYILEQKNKIGQNESNGGKKNGVTELDGNALDQINKDKLLMSQKFIDEHKNDLVSAYVLSDNMNGNQSVEKLMELYQKLSTEVQSSYYGVKSKRQLDLLGRLQVGSPFIDFVQNDVDNQPVSLSSFKGKYTLVDFWASWCGPCRKENPNLSLAYGRYHSKGLEVLGVSLDTDKSAWLAAIETDKLVWKQVSDLKGWKNEASQKYGIRSIPSNILFDKSGNIVAKNLKGEDLQRVLSEIFK